MVENDSLPVNLEKTLRNLMMGAGFLPLETEWWYFTLKNEPYPNTYFDFPIVKN